MSIGFLTDAAEGRKLLNFSFVASEILAICIPYSQTASVAIMPGPPEFVMIATLSPFGIGQLAKTFAVAKRFFKEYSLITPDCCKRAFAALSAPAKEPVCEDAADAPAADLPAFNARIGFFLEILDAKFLKLDGF